MGTDEHVYPEWQLLTACDWSGLTPERPFFGAAEANLLLQGVTPVWPGVIHQITCPDCAVLFDQCLEERARRIAEDREIVRQIEAKAESWT